jgi:hypothetical protein
LEFVIYVDARTNRAPWNLYREHLRQASSSLKE